MKILDKELQKLHIGFVAAVNKRIAELKKAIAKAAAKPAKEKVAAKKSVSQKKVVKPVKPKK